ncbi:MAG: cation:proton antiporter [Nanoarchaeota archaeon]|nr:cation:proton antiporter [Nanoarchaeota archaeon]
MDAFFLELSVIMMLVLGVCFLMHLIRQPLIIAYILVGIIAGPLFFNILSETQSYQLFSHIGVSFLLFIVGLHLNFKLIKEVGVVSLITGIGQVLFTSLIGFFLCRLLGFSFIAATITAIAITFSSTIIIVKLLSDKHDLDKLYGKISLGFLLVQDFIAVFILMIVGATLSIKEGGSNSTLLQTILLGILALVLTYVLSKKVLPKLLSKIASSSELLFVFIIAWCLGVSSMFAAFGFSIEIGALLAGIALASSHYQIEISSKVTPLRDFFLIMFFIVLGSQMIPLNSGIEFLTFGERLIFLFQQLSPILIPALLLSLFVLVGNPLIVLFLMTLLGYSSRTGFLAGLTVAQISEFSLILATLSFNAGFLSQEQVSMITLVGIITITASTYLIMNGEALFKLLRPLFSPLERKHLKDKERINKETEFDTVLLGANRVGSDLLETLVGLQRKVLVIDYNPEVIEKLKKKHIPALYADATHPDLYKELAENTSLSLIISTVPTLEASKTLLSTLRKKRSELTLIVTTHQTHHAIELYEKGADYVILPHHIGSLFMSDLLLSYQNRFDEFFKEKVTQLNKLKKKLS